MKGNFEQKGTELTEARGIAGQSIRTGIGLSGEFRERNLTTGQRRKLKEMARGGLTRISRIPANSIMSICDRDSVSELHRESPIVVR
jgi:hypothetical protein